MRFTRGLAAGTMVALVLSACSSTDGGNGGNTDGDRRMAPVTIEQVLTFEGETPAVVKGTLYSDSNGVRLCEAIGESFPVSCLGHQISVTDLDKFPEYAVLLIGDDEVKTSEGEVNVVGYYSDGNLRVDPSAAGSDAA